MENLYQFHSNMSQVCQSLDQNNGGQRRHPYLTSMLGMTSSCVFPSIQSVAYMTFTT